MSWHDPAAWISHINYYGVSSYKYAPQQISVYCDSGGGGMFGSLNFEIGQTNLPMQEAKFAHSIPKAPIFHFVQR